MGIYSGAQSSLHSLVYPICICMFASMSIFFWKGVGLTLNFWLHRMHHSPVQEYVGIGGYVDWSTSSSCTLRYIEEDWLVRCCCSYRFVLLDNFFSLSLILPHSILEESIKMCHLQLCLYINNECNYYREKKMQGHAFAPTFALDYSSIWLWEGIMQMTWWFLYITALHENNGSNWNLDKT